MKRRDIYLKAAELVATTHRYSCVAVDVACGHLAAYGWSTATEEYRKLFGDASGHLSFLQFERNKNPKELRILALCFMAAIAGHPR